MVWSVPHEGRDFVGHCLLTGSQNEGEVRTELCWCGDVDAEN
jgi:hypothetical protein